MIHDFQLPLPFRTMVATGDLPSSAIASVFGFLHRRKFRAPGDPIISHGLRAETNHKTHTSHIPICRIAIAFLIGKPNHNADSYDVKVDEGTERAFIYFFSFTHQHSIRNIYKQTAIVFFHTI